MVGASNGLRNVSSRLVLVDRLHLVVDVSDNGVRLTSLIGAPIMDI